MCFRCVQAIAADTVIAYITHDDRPNISSASSRHGAKQSCRSPSSATTPASQSNGRTVMMSAILLLTPPASSGERLCNSTVSFRPSVCLSVPSIASSSEVLLACRSPGSGGGRYRATSAAGARAERAASVLWCEEDRHRLVVRPHRMHAVQRCGFLLRMRRS